MITKISFLIATILSIIWVILFLFFDSGIYIYVIATAVLIMFGVSYVTRNKEQ